MRLVIHFDTKLKKTEVCNNMTRRNRIVLVVMLLVGLGILYFSVKNVNLNQIWHDFININWWWLVVAVLCISLYLVTEALIVKLFVGQRVPDFTFKNALRVPLVEQLGNGITPFASGGQPFQLVAMMQAGVDPGYSSAILLMKFIIYQFVIVINFFVALIIGSYYMGDQIHIMRYLMVFGFVIHFAVIVGLILVMYWYGLTKKLTAICLGFIKYFGFGGREKRMQRYYRANKWVDGRLENFHQESLRMSKDWTLILKGVLLTSLQLMFYYSIPYFIMLALGYTDVNYILITSLHILIVMVISIFPIPGGSGGAEVSFSSLFSSFIGNASSLVLAMLLWRFLTYYFGMFAGMFAFNMRADKVRGHSSWRFQSEEKK